MITVYSSFSSADAQLVRARLETAGFHAAVTDEIASFCMDGYSMATGGIRVQVPESEAEEVREFLALPEESAQ